ncbi:hypothetical protein KCU74_g67, partial [Aureobasidium melanogenum]
MNSFALNLAVRPDLLDSCLCRSCRFQCMFVLSGSLLDSFNNGLHRGKVVGCGGVNHDIMGCGLLGDEIQIINRAHRHFDILVPGPIRNTFLPDSDMLLCFWMVEAIALSVHWNLPITEVCIFHQRTRLYALYNFTSFIKHRLVAIC